MTSSEYVLTPRAQRFPFHVPLRYRSRNDTGWHKGTTVNVSRTGILFKTGENLTEESALDIEVKFLQKTLHCQGIVVRSQESAYAVRIYHCEFEPGSDC